MMPFQVLVSDHVTKPVKRMTVNQKRKRLNQALVHDGLAVLVVFRLGAVANDWQDEDHENHDQVGR